MHPVVTEIGQDEIKKNPQRERQMGDRSRGGVISRYNIVQAKDDRQYSASEGYVGDQVSSDDR
jgi:hypothetical protein